MTIIKLPGDWAFWDILWIGPNYGRVLFRFKHFYLVFWLWKSADYKWKNLWF